MGTAKRLRARYPNLFYGHPNTFEEPRPSEIGWASEANLVISSELFAEMGGYDPSLRYYETLEFSTRINKLGLKKMFEPAIDTTHFHEDYFSKKATRRAVASMGRVMAKSALMALRS